MIIREIKFLEIHDLWIENSWKGSIRSESGEIEEKERLEGDTGEEAERERITRTQKLQLQNSSSCALQSLKIFYFLLFFLFFFFSFVFFKENPSARRNYKTPSADRHAAPGEPVLPSSPRVAIDPFDIQRDPEAPRFIKNHYVPSNAIVLYTVT